MKRFITAALFGAAMLSASAAGAAERMIQLKVSGMTCPSCSYQVESSLKRLQGVKQAHADADAGRATVIYDDGRVSVQKMLRALYEAGYPARPAG